MMKIDKIKNLLTILLLMLTTNTFSQIRPAYNSGRFYDSSASRLLAEINGYYEKCNGVEQKTDLQAVIVPHAGYVFSAQVAATAYAAIDTSKHYDHIFLLGPSHYLWLDGASVNIYNDAYATPLGAVAVDRRTGKSLCNSEPLMRYERRAHDREHCLEVQLPLLQVRFGKDMPPIVPIIISTNDMGNLKRIANVLKPYFNEHNLFVVSSDFSHYPAYDDARHVDTLTCNAVLSGSVETFVSQMQKNDSLGIANLETSACGEFPIITLLYLLQGGHYKLSKLAYCNSGDAELADADRHRVVGYNAIAVERSDDKCSNFTLSDSDKDALLSLARNSIAAALDGEDCNPMGLPQVASIKCGAFVTLTEGGRLRGCIGHIGDDVPLGDVVCRMSKAAALEDPRFPRLTKAELQRVRIEISVLTPLKRINGIDDFVLHRDGLLVRKGYRSGTFLPQVADEVNWTKEEFFGHCSQDKAGLGWDGWRTAELYTYRAIVFSEKE